MKIKQNDGLGPVPGCIHCRSTTLGDLETTGCGWYRRNTQKGFDHLECGHEVDVNRKQQDGNREQQQAVGTVGP